MIEADTPHLQTVTARNVGARSSAVQLSIASVSLRRRVLRESSLKGRVHQRGRRMVAPTREDTGV